MTKMSISWNESYSDTFPHKSKAAAAKRLAAVKILWVKYLKDWDRCGLQYTCSGDVQQCNL